MKFLKYFLILVFFLFSLNLIFAHQPFYQVNVSDTVEINEWNLCWQVTNNGLYDIMVPTNTSLEWALFNQSHPSNIELNECGDGYIWVKNDGIYQSGNGANYVKIYDSNGWPSTKDGDMVVINAEELRVDSDAVLTTTNRCRGLLIYANLAIIDGNISMSGRGAHANPDETKVTINTPVPPSDGNAVPNDGLTIRRDKSVWFDINDIIIEKSNANNINDFRGSDSRTDLFYGTGNASIKTESIQPVVNDGLVIKIPKVGGIAGTGVTHSTTYVKGIDGSSIQFGTGGGGSGGVYHWDDDGCRGSPSRSGSGSVGTVFSGGSGGGGGNCGSGTSAKAFGGNGGNTGGSCHGCPYGVGGFGNDNGGGARWLTDEKTGKPSGAGGLLILDVNKLELNGYLLSQGYSFGSGFWSPTWAYGSNDGRVLGSAGGGSGGGVVVAMYRDITSTVSPNNLNSESIYLGGGSVRAGITFVKGGDGSAIGPILIDSKECGSEEYLYDGECVSVNWVELGDWSDCSVECGNGTQTQTVRCETENGDIINDIFCSNLVKPNETKICETGIACPTWVSGYGCNACPLGHVYSSICDDIHICVNSENVNVEQTGYGCEKSYNRNHINKICTCSGDSSGVGSNHKWNCSFNLG